MATMTRGQVLETVRKARNAGERADLTGADLTNANTIAVVVDMQKGFNPSRSAVAATRNFLERAPLDAPPVFTAMPFDGKSPISHQNGWVEPEQHLRAIEGIADLPHRLVYKDGYSAAEVVPGPPGRAILMGGDTDGCLLATAFGLVDKGWRVYVLSDCCFSSGGETVNEAGLTVLRRSLGSANVLPSADMLARL